MSEKLCGQGGGYKPVQGEMVCLCVSNGQGRVRDVGALLRVWPPRPRPWALSQRWGLALGPGWGAPTEKFLRVLPGATGARLPCPRARRSRRPRCACSLHLSTAKPLGIYLSLSVSGCARLCLCAHRRLCVCACLCLCMYLGLCLSVSGCWSMPVLMTVSACVCVSKFICVYGALCVLGLCLSRAGPLDCLCVVVGLCGLGVRECCAFEAVGLDLSVSVSLCLCM